MSDLPSNWGITTPDRLLSNLRVAETGGDMAECADALEWMLRSGRLVDREAIDYEPAAQLLSGLIFQSADDSAPGEFDDYADRESRRIVDAALPDLEV